MPTDEENIIDYSQSPSLDLDNLNPEDFKNNVPNDTIFNESEEILNTDEEENEERVDEQDEEDEVDEVDEVDEQDEEDVDDYYNQLSEVTGYDITSNEDITSAFAELDELREAQENKYADLPNELKLAIDVFNKGGDYKTALSQLSMDYESMDSKDVLKQSYFNDPKNAKLLSENKEFAERKFEKQYNISYETLNKYNKIVDEDEKADFYADNKDEIDYEKLAYEHDVKNARNSMNEFKSQATSVQNNPNQPSEEQMQEWMQEHTSSVDSAINEYTGIDISLGDKMESNFTIKLGEDEMQLMKETLDQPQEFLREIMGIELKDGHYVDYHKFASAYTLLQYADKLGSVLGQAYMEKTDKKTVERMLANPPSAKDKNERPGVHKTDLEEAFSAFSQLNKRNMK